MYCKHCMYCTVCTAVLQGPSVISGEEDREQCKISSINHGQLSGCVSHHVLTVSLLLTMIKDPHMIE